MAIKNKDSGNDNSKKGNGEILSYHEFKTGLNFADVYSMLMHERDARYRQGVYEPSDFALDVIKNPRSARRAVLGRWHQIKTQSYRAYVDNMSRGDIKRTYSCGGIDSIVGSSWNYAKSQEDEDLPF